MKQSLFWLGLCGVFVVAGILTQWLPNPHEVEHSFDYGFPVVYGWRSIGVDWEQDPFVPAGLTWISRTNQSHFDFAQLLANLAFIAVAAVGCYHLVRNRASCSLASPSRAMFVFVTLIGVFTALSLHRAITTWETAWCLSVSTLLACFAIGAGTIFGLRPITGHIESDTTGGPRRTALYCASNARVQSFWDSWRRSPLVLLFFAAVLLIEWLPSPFWEPQMHYYGYPVIFGTRSGFSEIIDDLTTKHSGISWLSPTMSSEFHFATCLVDVAFLLVAVLGAYRLCQAPIAWPTRASLRAFFLFTTIAGIVVALFLDRKEFIWETAWCLSVTLVLCCFLVGLARLCGIDLDNSRVPAVGVANQGA